MSSPKSKKRSAGARPGSRPVSKPAVKKAAAEQVGARKNPAATKRPSAKPGKAPVYRQRKNPPLPLVFKVVLALGWLAVNALVWYLVDDAAFRVGVAIVTLFAVPLIVVLAYNPSRRRRR